MLWHWLAGFLHHQQYHPIFPWEIYFSDNSIWSSKSGFLFKNSKLDDTWWHSKPFRGDIHLGKLNRDLKHDLFTPNWWWKVREMGPLISWEIHIGEILFQFGQISWFNHQLDKLIFLFNLPQLLGWSQEAPAEDAFGPHYANIPWVPWVGRSLQHQSKNGEKGRLGLFFSKFGLLFFFAKQEQNTWNLKIEAFHISIIMTNQFVKPPLSCSSSFLGYSCNSGIIFTCWALMVAVFPADLVVYFCCETTSHPIVRFMVLGYLNPSRCLIKSPISATKIVYLARLRTLVWDGEAVTLSTGMRI